MTRIALHTQRGTNEWGRPTVRQLWVGGDARRFAIARSRKGVLAILRRERAREAASS